MAFAPTMADVVRAAGGWLVDQVLAGADVLVLVSERSDPRPVEILGARAEHLDSALATRVHGPRPHTLAVGADLYGAHPRVHRLVQRLLETGLTEVRLWDDDWSVELDDEAEPLRHRLSLAARAFKAQALVAAAAASGPVEDTEVFFNGDLLPVPPDVPHLIPV
ncbi:hypothetical protein ACPZ19_42910 [Amycolatopsis lurida]